MNVWLKGILTVFFVGLIWLWGRIFFGYNEVFAVMLSLIVIVFFFLIDRINWALLFNKERDVLSAEEWKHRAISALERNHPIGLANRGYKFEADVLYSVPIGVLWVFLPGPDFPLCAFGEVWADSENPIVSPLQDLNAHLHNTHSKSIMDAGRAYLRNFAELKTKKEKENSEEVLE